MNRFVVRSAWPTHASAPPAPPQAQSSWTLRAQEPPHRRVRFDAFPSEAAARAWGHTAYRLRCEVAGVWTAAPQYAVFAEWQIADDAHAAAFEASRRELFELRRRHLPTFAFDWLLQDLERPERYLVLGMYGDEAGATRLCRLHPSILPYLQAHPPADYGATDLSGLQCFRVERGEALASQPSQPLDPVAGPPRAPAAPEATEIRVELGTDSHPQLVRWSASGRYGDNPDVQHHSYAVVADDGVVLIDPTVPALASQERLEALLALGGRPPLATVLTSSWHERSAYTLRARFGTPVWLPRGGVQEMEGTPDCLYGEETALPGGLRAITIDDATAGDTALIWQHATGGRVLFTGDAILGGSRKPGHWRAAPGMYAWMHGQIAAADFMARFRRLLEESFQVVCSAHGWPVPLRDDPRATLARLLERGRFGRPAFGMGLAPAP
ncbi:MAG TPA: MBL fold metallo-hydrolase [Chloroflexota bacterium]|nr:MBL fold metallo-hydrolase [Chloroflexota bacterium]